MIDRRSRKSFLALACLGVALACKSPTSPCSGPSQPAILLTILDGVTSRPIGTSVTIIYDRHGDDSLTVINTHPTSTPISIGSAPGTYDLRVIASGYADWLTTNEVIQSDGCQAQTIATMIFMQPLP